MNSSSQGCPVSPHYTTMQSNAVISIQHVDHAIFESVHVLSWLWSERDYGNITAKLVLLSKRQLASQSTFLQPFGMWVANVLKYLSNAIDAGSFLWKELMWRTLEQVCLCWQTATTIIKSTRMFETIELHHMTFGKFSWVAWLIFTCFVLIFFTSVMIKQGSLWYSKLSRCHTNG